MCRRTMASRQHSSWRCSSPREETAVKPDSAGAPAAAACSPEAARSAAAWAIYPQLSPPVSTGSAGPGSTATGPSSAKKASSAARSPETVTSSSGAKQARAPSANFGAQTIKNRLTPSAFSFSPAHASSGQKSTVSSISGFSPFSREGSHSIFTTARI